MFLRKKPILEGTIFSTSDVPNNSRNQIKLKLLLRKTDGEILFAQGEENFADLIPLQFYHISFRGSCTYARREFSSWQHRFFVQEHIWFGWIQIFHVGWSKEQAYILILLHNWKLPSRYYQLSIIHDQLCITSGFRVYNILNETCTRLKLVDPKSSKDGQEKVMSRDLRCSWLKMIWLLNQCLLVQLFLFSIVWKLRLVTWQKRLSSLVSRRYQGCYVCLVHLYLPN